MEVLIDIMVENIGGTLMLIFDMSRKVSSIDYNDLLKDYSAIVIMAAGSIIFLLYFSGGHFILKTTN